MVIKIDRVEKCPECDGVGWREIFYNSIDRFPEKEDCMFCMGSGSVEYNRYLDWLRDNDPLVYDETINNVGKDG